MNIIIHISRIEHSIRPFSSTRVSNYSLIISSDYVVISFNPIIVSIYSCVVLNELDGLTRAGVSPESDSLLSRVVEFKTKGRTHYWRPGRRAGNTLADDDEEVSDSEGAPSKATQPTPSSCNVSSGASGGASGANVAAGGGTAGGSADGSVRRQEVKTRLLRTRAKAAIAWLEHEFEEAHHPRLKAVTHRGNALNTIQFRSEQFEVPPLLLSISLLNSDIVACLCIIDWPSLHMKSTTTLKC